MFLHGRILRPFLGLNLLFMSLPLVLGGYGPEHVHQPGLCVGNSAMFYGAILVCGYLGGSGMSRRSCQRGFRSWSSARSPPTAGTKFEPEPATQVAAPVAAQIRISRAKPIIPATCSRAATGSESCRSRARVGERGLTGPKQSDDATSRPDDHDADGQAVTGAGQLCGRAVRSLAGRNGPSARRA